MHFSLKRMFSQLSDGMASIGRGMASFDLFPTADYDVGKLRTRMMAERVQRRQQLESGLGAYRCGNGFADDAKALASDWRAVGDDMRRAIKKAKQAQPK